MTRLLRLLPLLPVLILAFWIPHVWVNIPFHDDWGTPGRQLAQWCNGQSFFTGWFAQHNESRPFFPRLIFLPLAWFFGWDVRQVMAVIFAMVFAASLLLRGLVKKLPDISPWGAAFVMLAMNFILFWPNSEIWTFANTLMLVFPPLVLLGAIHVNLSGMPLRRKALWNALFATISTFSWSNGLLLWLLAIPVPSTAFARTDEGEGRGVEKTKARCAAWYGVYAAAFAANLLFYFHDYRRPADAPPFSWNVAQLAGYFFTLIGGFFGDEEQACGVGVVVFVVFCALAGAALAVDFRRRDFSRSYPWLMPGMYVVMSGAVAALGRSAFGNSQAMSPRYSAVTGYLYVAIIGLGWLWWRETGPKHPKEKRIMGMIAVAVALICTPFIGLGYMRGLQVLKSVGGHRRVLRMAWEWSRVLPANPALEVLLPNVNALQHFGGVLESHGILRIPRIDPAATFGWKYDRNAAGNENGELDTCEKESDGWLLLSGWVRGAGGSGGNTTPDCVMITVSGPDGIPRPWTVLPCDLDSPAIAKFLKDEHLGHNGFNMAVPMDALPKGRYLFRAWAVDVKQFSIRPLARGFMVENR